MSGSPTLILELYQFKKSIAENTRCYAFLQNLRVNEKEPNFMDKVYVEFIEIETNNRLFNNILFHSLANTTSSSSNKDNSNFNNKKKDDKKGGGDNDKSNSYLKGKDNKDKK